MGAKQKSSGGGHAAHQGAFMQSAQSHGSFGAQNASTSHITHVGVPAQSTHSHVSPIAMSHVPSGMPPWHAATTSRHWGCSQQSSQWQPSAYESQMASLMQASGGHTELP
jgi:hypothetical protein